MFLNVIWMILSGCWRLKCLRNSIIRNWSIWTRNWWLGTTKKWTRKKRRTPTVNKCSPVFLCGRISVLPLRKIAEKQSAPEMNVVSKSYGDSSGAIIHLLPKPASLFGKPLALRRNLMSQKQRELAGQDLRCRGYKVCTSPSTGNWWKSI